MQLTIWGAHQHAYIFGFNKISVYGGIGEMVFHFQGTSTSIHLHHII